MVTRLKTQLICPMLLSYLQQQPSNTSSKWEINVFLQSKIQLYGSLTQEAFFHLEIKLQPSSINLNNPSCITSWAASPSAFPSPPCSYQSSHLPHFRTSLWPTENTARRTRPCDSLCRVMALAKGLCLLLKNSGGNRGTGHPKWTSPPCQYVDIQPWQILRHRANLLLILLFVFKT